MGPVIRILLAEDHRILREGLCAIFRAEPDLRVVGEATDGFEAIDLVREIPCDLLILDLSMPRMDGLVALKKIKRISPCVRVLVMTIHKTEDHVFRAIQEGADGYVLKDSSAAELLLAVRRVVAGERYLCSAVATQFVNAFLQGNTLANPVSKIDRLSSREREVLKLVAEGYTSRQIGDYLCISEKTVEKHRGNMMRKLEVSGISAVTAYAIENGLVAI